MRPSRWFALIPALVLCSPVVAQDAWKRQSQELQFRGGWFFPTGNSDFWDENEQVFTIETGDFDDFIFGVTLLTPVNNHVEVGFNVDFYDDGVVSEYRDFTDSNGFPILHDSKLDVVPMTVDFRILPGGRTSEHRSRGRYIQRKPAVYFGGGVGVSYWKYEESGDFIDFQLDPPEIYSDRFKDDGFALTLQAVAGVEVPLGARWNAIAEARYTWADDDLSGDFAGLGTLDLGGLAVYAGVGFRF
jgi:hypothetical protein